MFKSQNHLTENYPHKFKRGRYIVTVDVECSCGETHRPAITVDLFEEVLCDSTYKLSRAVTIHGYGTCDEIISIDSVVLNVNNTRPASK